MPPDVPLALDRSLVGGYISAAHGGSLARRFPFGIVDAGLREIFAMLAAVSVGHASQLEPRLLCHCCFSRIGAHAVSRGDSGD